MRRTCLFVTLNYFQQLDILLKKHLMLFVTNELSHFLKSWLSKKNHVEYCSTVLNFSNKYKISCDFYCYYDMYYGGSGVNFNVDMVVSIAIVIFTITMTYITRVVKMSRLMRASDFLKLSPKNSYLNGLHFYYSSSDLSGLQATRS